MKAHGFTDILPLYGRNFFVHQVAYVKEEKDNICIGITIFQAEPTLSSITLVKIN